MKKIYISGCGGMLGEAFYKRFKTDYHLKCTDIDQNENWLEYLDIRNFAAYKEDVFNYKPDYLFHLGALTDLEYCEQHPNDAYMTNTLAVENAVLIANYLQIPILYISTAGIFDGEKKYFDDWDQPNPISVYARSKYMGERYVIENANLYLICRAGWMMGGGLQKDKKFIQKLMKQIVNGQKTLKVVNDRDGTPTYTHDFALNVKLLIEHELWGLYNMVCGGQTSRLEVARELLKIMDLGKIISIVSVDSTYFKEIYFAPRPQSERLINMKLDLRNLNVMRSWKVALREYLEDYYYNYLEKPTEL